MKFRILFMSLLVAGIFTFQNANAEEQTREVSPFSEVSLRVSGKLYLTQGDQQSVKVVAKASVLADLVTEVVGKKLIVRFPTKTIFQRNFDPGKIEIYVTVPDVSDLSVSGSGDIIAEDLNARILGLSLSGSGGIKIGSLESNSLKCSVSGSGSIEIEEGGPADELNINISGSGNFNGIGFEATNVTVNTAGSGNCNITSNGSIKGRIAGSGSIYYRGNPSVDASTLGSGRIQKK